MAVVPHVTQGTWARRFSSSQMRRRTRLNPPSDCRLPLRLQIARGAELQVQTLIEVVARLAVATPDLVGHVCTQKASRLLAEGLVLVGQLDPGEVHRCSRPRSGALWRALAGRDDLGDPHGGGARIAAGQRPSPGAHQIRRGRGFRRNPKAALDMDRHRRRLGGLLGHEHESRRRQLGSFVGFVVQEPGGPPGEVAPALNA